jgi:hypothetical protein
MQFPDIIFSEWHKWPNRKSIVNSRDPGVYLLAKFENGQPTSGAADPLESHVVYIGETCASLRQRWNQFDNSAFRGRRGHSGGLTYKARINDEGKDLFVAAFAVSENLVPEVLRSTFIQFVERKLILDFVMNHENRLPFCNTK